MSNAPLPVHIVRPKRRTGESVGSLIGIFLRPFIRALLVWWLAPTVWDGFTLTYWETVALVVAARAVIGTSNEDYRIWTRGEVVR